MRATATITSKGQITIPQKIRSFLGLHSGVVAFLVDNEGKIQLIPITIDVRELKGLLPKPNKKVTIEQMNKVIREKGSES